MSNGLVLSVFPGIDLLGKAFETEGYCLVRGPDVLWGGDVRQFKPPAGVFEGVIGGPPCQAFSPLRHLVRHVYGESAIAENLIPEFERVVSEAQPTWFVMENSPYAPAPVVCGYIVRERVLNNRWLGEVQNRQRRFCFGTQDGRVLEIAEVALEPCQWEPAVVSSARTVAVAYGGSGQIKSTAKNNQPRTIADMLRLQGFAEDMLDDAPFTQDGKRKMIANGVPLPMGRAIAKAVKKAMEVS